MNRSQYHAECNLASVEPGAQWKHVYRDLLDNSNVMVTGGRDGGVGVGGFLLGGGMSYYTGLNGFACDTVINYEVVLANGTIVQANASSNASLWKALKGGIFNFGIVTRFDLHTMPAENLAYGESVVQAAYSDSMVDALFEFTEASEQQPEDALFLLYSHDTSIAEDITVLAVQVNTRGNLNSTGFDKIRTIPSLTRSSELMSLADAANVSQLAPGSKYVYPFYHTLEAAHANLSLSQECADGTDGLE